MLRHTMFVSNWDELRTEGRPGLAGLTGVRSSSGKCWAMTGERVAHRFLGADWTKPAGFPLKDAMVKIAHGKPTNDSSARQRPGCSQTIWAARLDHLWQEFKALGEGIDASVADGKPVAALRRKQEDLRARSWALALHGEGARLALAECSIGRARRRGNKPKAGTDDF